MNKKIVFCGGGNMAEGMLGGILKNSVAEAANITVSELLPERCEYLSDTYGVTAVSDASYALKEADVVIIAVLPKHIKSVTSVVKGLISEQTLVLSIAAGVELATLEDQLGSDKKIVRIMPNTLIQSGNGHSAVCYNGNLTDEDKKDAEEILNSLGQIIVLPEDMFGTFTAFSCSGPMWLYKTAESMIDAGVYVGFSRKDATRMVIKNMLGVGQVLDESGVSAAEKVNAMCSPGGVTIEGMKSLEDGGFKATIMESVAVAVDKANNI